MTLTTDSEVRNLLRGAVDMHYHSGPSPFPRKMDTAQAARHFDEAGFRAVVMKSHHHSTVMEILALQSSVLVNLDIAVYGGVALNGAVGGLNPMAVDLALKMGGRVVWFPTMSSRAHIAYHERHHDSPFPTATIPLLPEKEVDVFADDGRLKPEVHDIIDLIKEGDAVLSFGHMAPPQVEAVLQAARRAGVQRFVLSHPDFVQSVSHEQAARYARQGVYIEHCIGMYNDQARNSALPIGRLLEWIRVVGVDHTTLSSDVGQLTNPTAVDTYARVVTLLLKAGVPKEDVIKMISVNPSALLGIS